MTRPSRPVFLNLTQIHMPIGAIASIGHRLSGVLLAASVPFGVALLDRSLQHEQGSQRLPACSVTMPSRRPCCSWSGRSLTTCSLAYVTC